MKLIKPSYKIETPINRINILKTLELFGRVCYKSEGLITEDSSSKFVKMIVNKGHISVVDHVYISVRFIVNRGFTHELIRHRIAAYSQESTRFCNYIKDKFNGHITFIIPPHLDITPGVYNDTSTSIKVGNSFLWAHHMLDCESVYNSAIKNNWKPQEARGLLPIDLKTEIIMTANLTEWLHVFRLRTDPAAHPQMREIMIPLSKEFENELPEIFKKEDK